MCVVTFNAVVLQLSVQLNVGKWTTANLSPSKRICHGNNVFVYSSLNNYNQYQLNEICNASEKFIYKNIIYFVWWRQSSINCNVNKQG